jgi:hypothetical protein
LIPDNSYKMPAASRFTSGKGVSRMVSGHHGHARHSHPATHERTRKNTLTTENWRKTLAGTNFSESSSAEYERTMLVNSQATCGLTETTASNRSWRYTGKVKQASRNTEPSTQSSKFAQYPLAADIEDEFLESLRETIDMASEDEELVVVRDFKPMTINLLGNNVELVDRFVIDVSPVDRDIIDTHIQMANAELKYLGNNNRGGSTRNRLAARLSHRQGFEEKMNADLMAVDPAIVKIGSANTSACGLDNKEPNAKDYRFRKLISRLGIPDLSPIEEPSHTGREIPCLNGCTRPVPSSSFVENDLAPSCGTRGGDPSKRMNPAAAEFKSSKNMPTPPFQFSPKRLSRPSLAGVFPEPFELVAGGRFLEDVNQHCLQPLSDLFPPLDFHQQSYSTHQGSSTHMEGMGQQGFDWATMGMGQGNPVPPQSSLGGQYLPEHQGPTFSDFTASQTVPYRPNTMPLNLGNGLPGANMGSVSSGIGFSSFSPSPVLGIPPPPTRPILPDFRAGYGTQATFNTFPPHYGAVNPTFPEPPYAGTPFNPIPRFDQMDLVPGSLNGIAAGQPARPPMPMMQKPRDHNPVKQQQYEAYLEWRKANEPGYHEACKMRQANRVLRTFNNQGGDSA